MVMISKESHGVSYRARVVELLRRIRGPMNYSYEDSFSRLSSVKNLGAYVARQLKVFLNPNASPPHQGSLSEDLPNSVVQDIRTLFALFKDYDQQPTQTRQDRLRQAFALMEHLNRQVQPHPKPINRLDPPHWAMDVQYMKGVGGKRAEAFGRLGVKTFEDLLYFVPWRYEDRGNLKKIAEIAPGEEYTLCVQIHSTRIHTTPKKRLQIFEAVMRDETGWLAVKWFNQPYLKNVLKQGRWLMLSGKARISPYDGYLGMENPQFELLDQTPHDPALSGEELIHTGRIVPIYHETRGLSSRVIRTLMKAVLDTWAECIPDTLPEDLRTRQQLPALGETLRQVHFPDRTGSLEAFNRGVTPYHRRLAFDDFFLLQLGLALKRRERVEEARGIPFITEGPLLDRFLNQLPFGLTTAQQRVIEEIKQDMARPRPMNRLIQGDVGCGKTLVAVVALIIAIENGYQGALMAPTEILAEQHYLMMKRWFSDLGLKVVLLTSGQGRQKRMETENRLQEGEVHLAVGTHALIQEGVRFKRLGMVIVDEQHKFGVLQRRDLVQKGPHPDVLIMTATPIPRTLALSVYGDLDVSVIDELPPGRTPVETLLLDESRRARGYEILDRELRAGRQVYVVYPLVEESEKSDLKAAVQMARHLQEDIFPDWCVGLLHGQMKTEEKETVMSRFKDRQIHILVATSVIEVGIDVPNATLMLIEHAERFGLAQLHQLRGRVGRGSHQSFCILIAGKRLTQEARRRLEVMVKYRDGFAIAEQDLTLRGPGEFFGTRQSGLPELKVANLIRDVRILEAARQEAFGLMQRDPQLCRPEHDQLRKALVRRWKDRLDLAMIS